MLSCEQFEVLLADHIDGTLAEATREEFVRHLETCAACAAYAAEVQNAVSFIEIAADVEPPSELTGKILQATNSGWEFKLRARGVRGWINRTFAPVLKPRFVMGAMLTMMSITMLSRCAGDPKKPLTAADLDPVRLWSSLDVRTHRLWDRTVKSYDSMRLVYEIRTQLNEWKQQQAEADEAAALEHANSRKLNGAAPEKTSATPDKSQETQQK
jgi:hypothetical protein